MSIFLNFYTSFQKIVLGGMVVLDKSKTILSLRNQNECKNAIVNAFDNQEY
jgi:hypothetical protein